MKWPRMGFNAAAAAGFSGDSGLVEVVGRPEVIQRARPVRVKTHPWLAAAAPMEETHRPPVEVPAAAVDVVPTEPMLIPPVIDRRHVPREH